MGLFNVFKSKKALTPELRREKNNSYIKSREIACFDNLPIRESSDEVKLRDLDSICKRAIACLLIIQLAYDIAGGNDYEESKTLILRMLKHFQVEDALLPIEKQLLDNNYTDQDVINVCWSYECYWSLIWAMGLVSDEEMKMGNGVCDYEKAITLVLKSGNFETFKSKAKLRNIEEILDMLDLYYRYHWACCEKQINPNTNIADLNSDVVFERRKGLEWLVSSVADWNDISLDT